MTQLVTLARVKSSLSVDTDDKDEDLTLMIEAASGAVLNYLYDAEDRSPPLIDLQSSPQVIPSEVQFATIMLVGFMYRNPDADPDGDWERGYLPKPVTALLYPLRDPTIA